MTEESSIYQEVLDVLKFDLVADSDDDDDDEGNGSGFNLRNMIMPLGIGANNWSFNPLGLVSTLGGAHKASNLPASDQSKLSSMDRESHSPKIFHVEFQEKELPFEYKLHSSGKLIVSNCYGPTDHRIEKGVTIFGINKTPLPVSPNSVAFFEEMINKVGIPFNIVFETIDLQHRENPYEEEEDEDDEEGVEESTEEEESAEEDNSQHQLQQQSGQRLQQNFIIQTGMKTMSTIGNRVRALVTGPGVGGIVEHHDHNNNNNNTTHNTPPKSTPTNTSTENESDDYDDGTFPLVLSGRSPPFVYDLHADGRSIVVVKLLDTSSATPSAKLSSSSTTGQGQQNTSVSHLMQEGCLVRRMNGRQLTCSSRAEFEQLLATERLPIRLDLEAAPALYRHQDALRLYTSSKREPHLHVFTVLPSVTDVRTRPKGGLFGAGDTGFEYDDVFLTARRATQVLQAFRAQGVAVSLVTIETVLVNAASSAYAGLMQSPGAACVRGVRVWFRFSDAVEIGPIEDGHKHLSALQVLPAHITGSWIVLRCVAESPWVDAGMVLGRPYLLTHVNGRDISASGYRSVQPRVKGDGDWEDSVLPLLQQEGSKIRLTVV